MIPNLRFQYEEKSLNGIVTNLKNSYPQLYSKLKHTIYPLFSSTYNSSNCFDRNPYTFCHSLNSSSAYFEVYFPKYKIVLDGYSIQNREGYVWDILNMKIPCVLVQEMI